MSERRSRSLRDSGLVSEYLDVIVYGAFAVVGSMLIVFAKLLSMHTAVLIAIPCVVLIGYAVACFQIPRLDLRRDQLGDNVYYLGFLLTLVSLTVTLVQFASDSSDEQIISNFGLALVATIVGIGARTILNQMRRDPLSVEKESRVELAKASARLRSQVMSSVEDFASLHRQMKQVQEQAMTDMQDAYRAMGQGLSEAVIESVQEFNSGVNQLNQSLASHNNAMSRSIEKLSEVSDKLSELDLDPSQIVTLSDALRSFADGVENKIEGLTDKIASNNQAVEESSHSFETSLDNLDSKIQEFGMKLSGLGESAESVQPKINALLQINETLEALASAGQNSSSAVQQLTQTVSEMSQQLQSYGQSDMTLAELSSQLSALMETSKELITKITADLGEADQIVDALREKQARSGFSLGRLFGKSDSEP